MSKRKEIYFTLDIINACENILEYVKGMEFEDFLKDKKTIDAVIRNIEIIGEAAKNVSDELKGKYSDVEWRNLARIRDRLIHGYFGVDLEIIWNTAKINIPSLLKKVRKIVEKENHN